MCVGCDTQIAPSLALSPVGRVSLSAAWPGQPAPTCACPAWPRHGTHPAAGRSAAAVAAMAKRWVCGQRGQEFSRPTAPGRPATGFSLLLASSGKPLLTALVQPPVEGGDEGNG